jgi:hypothetical protein
MIKRVYDLRLPSKVDTANLVGAENIGNLTLEAQKSPECGNDEDNESSDKESIENTPPKVQSYFSALFSGIMHKKRKLDELDQDVKSPSVKFAIKSRPIRPLPQKRHSESFAQVKWQQIFEKCPVYTYMTFPQLETVKNDGIVPSSTVLSSYWLQAELATNPSIGIPKFRFACKFLDVSTHFLEDGAPDMYSEPVSCAGIQYRILISREDRCLKALLQRSKGHDAYGVQYSIYLVDHRAPMDTEYLLRFLDPITTCDKSGSGHAYGIELEKCVKHEKEQFLDEVWLIAVVSFE